ncbi:hypothetical protein DFH11DRAFT_1578653 [Phellopilus nigrolimitatus]|nr:hypothetical protein DFH11DRAFT_1578653 [Phellopilus nigrolimitatus]
MSSSTSNKANDLYAVADFCLIPMGLGEPSVRLRRTSVGFHALRLGSKVAKYIAECQVVLQKTGLTFKMHGYGTNIEGPWSEVMQAIYECHAAVHAQGAPRIATDIRIGTRTDRETPSGTGNNGKVTRVEQILAGKRDEK